MNLDDSDLRKIQKAYEIVKNANIPIKRYSDKDFSDDEIRELVKVIRNKLDEIAKDPQKEEFYETQGKDWQDQYDILMHLADMRAVNLTEEQ